MAQGSSNQSTNISKISGNPISVNSGNTDTGTQRVVIASNQSRIPTENIQIAFSLSSVNISGTAGQLSCLQSDSAILEVGKLITISGTLTGTGSIAGYSSPKTYKISETNGSTTFTIKELNGNAVVTTAGNTTGLIFSIRAHHEVAVIGKVTADISSALPAGDNNIGNVDVVSSALPTGAATSANQSTMITSLQLLDDTVATDGSAASTKLLQVGGTDGTNSQILSTNTSGHLNIADGGNSITVDGTVELGSTTLAALETISATQSGTWTVGLSAGTNNIGDVDVLSLPSIPSGTNTIGNVGLVPNSTATNALSNATTTAYAASIIAKASAGVLYNITGYNSRSSQQFIQLHDSATVPSDTAIPKVIFVVPAMSNFSFDLGVHGRYFSSGIVLCNSSTATTKTIGSADCWFDIQYK